MLPKQKKPEGFKPTWPVAKLEKLFGDYIFSRENKPFKLLFQGPLAPMALLPRKSWNPFLDEKSKPQTKREKLV